MEKHKNWEWNTTIPEARITYALKEQSNLLRIEPEDLDVYGS